MKSAKIVQVRLQAKSVATHTWCYILLNEYRKNVKNYYVKSVLTTPSPLLDMAILCLRIRLTRTDSDVSDIQLEQ